MRSLTPAELLAYSQKKTCLYKYNKPCECPFQSEMSCIDSPHFVKIKIACIRATRRKVEKDLAKAELNAEKDSAFDLVNSRYWKRKESQISKEGEKFLYELCRKKGISKTGSQKSFTKDGESGRGKPSKSKQLPSRCIPRKEEDKRREYTSNKKNYSKSVKAKDSKNGSSDRRVILRKINKEFSSSIKDRLDDTIGKKYGITKDCEF